MRDEDYLTPEDNAALDALGPDLAGKIVRGEPVGEHARLRKAVDAIKAASRDGRLDAFTVDSILCEFGEATRPGEPCGMDCKDCIAGHDMTPCMDPTAVKYRVAHPGSTLTQEPVDIHAKPRPDRTPAEFARWLASQRGRGNPRQG